MLSVAEPEFCVNSMNMDPFCLAEDEVSGIKYGGIKAIYYTQLMLKYQYSIL